MIRNLRPRVSSENGGSMIALIVAYDKNRVIGNHGKIPWHIEGEQHRFRDLTTGNVVVMGRRTFEEIGHGLPNRFTFVVSNTKNFDADNVLTVASLKEALLKASDIFPEKDVFLSGGAGIYEEGIQYCDKLYVTEIDASYEGDVYFPEFDHQAYERVVESRVKTPVCYTYVTYVRKE